MMSILTFIYRFIVGVIVFAIALIVIAIFGLNYGIFNSKIKDFAIKKVNGMFPMEFSIGELKGNLLGNVTLENVVIYSPMDSTKLNFSNLNLKYSLFAVLDKKLKINEIKIDSFEILTPSFENLNGTIGRLKNPKGIKSNDSSGTEKKDSQIDLTMIRKIEIENGNMNEPDSLTKNLPIRFNNLKLDGFFALNNDSIAFILEKVAGDFYTKDNSIGSNSVFKNFKKDDSKNEHNELIAIDNTLSVKLLKSFSIYYYGSSKNLWFNTSLGIDENVLNLQSKVNLRDTMTVSYDINSLLKNIDISNFASGLKSEKLFDCVLDIKGIYKSEYPFNMEYILNAPSLELFNRSFSEISMRGNFIKESISGNINVIMDSCIVSGDYSLNSIFKNPFLEFYGNFSSKNIGYLINNPTLNINSTGNVSISIADFKNPRISIKSNIDSLFYRDLPYISITSDLEIENNFAKINDMIIRQLDNHIVINGTVKDWNSLDLHYNTLVNDISRYVPNKSQKFLAKVNGNVSGELNNISIDGEYTINNFYNEKVNIENLSGNFWTNPQQGDFKLDGKALLVESDSVSEISKKDTTQKFTIFNKELPFSLDGKFYYKDEYQGVDIQFMKFNITDTWWENSHPFSFGVRNKEMNLNNFNIQSKYANVSTDFQILNNSEIKGVVKINCPDISLLNYFITGDTLFNGELEFDTEIFGSVTKPGFSSNMNLSNFRYGEIKVDTINGNADINENFLNFNIRSVGPDSATATFSGNYDLRNDSSIIKQIENFRNCSMKIYVNNLPIEGLGRFITGVSELKGCVSSTIVYENSGGKNSVSGYAHLKDGQIFINDMGENFGNIEAEAVLSDTVLTIKSLKANSTTGKIDVNGAMILKGLIPQKFKASLLANDLTVLSNPQLTVISDVQSEVNGDILEKKLSGSVTIKDTDIQIRSVQGKQNVEVIRIDTLQREISKIKNPWQFNITLNLGNNVWARGAGVNSQVTGTIDVQSNGENVLLFGPLNIQRGFYEFYGKQFKLTKGSIVFQGSNPPDPQVDIIGEYSLRDIKIDISITGNSKNLSIKLTSNPQMEENDIISYLTFGKPYSVLSGGQQRSIEKYSSNTAQAASFALGLIGSNLAKAIGKELELDVVNVRGGMSDFSLEVGKYISENVFLYYTHQVGNVGNKRLVVEYQVSDRLILQAEKGEATQGEINLLYILRW
jgi:hypothetical protein